MKRDAWVVLVLGMVLGIVAGVVGVRAQDGGVGRLEPLPAGSPYQPNSEEQAIADVYNRVVLSVVNVSVASRQGGVGTGSGFVIDTDGHIVTNNHVVEDAAYIEVSFVDGTVAAADLVGRDPDADMAVLRINPEGLTLHPVTFADSSQVFVGQEVMAIGSPFGQNQAFTLTTGIVSAMERSLRQATSFTLPELIQTDAAINPGNSGGPLIDLAGDVVGINTAILSESRTASGVGFAIPSNAVRRIVPYLIQNGEYQHSWLGIEGTSLTAQQIDALGLIAATRGAMVTRVVPDSPAAEAGLQGATGQSESPFGAPIPLGGDIIVGVNDQPITQMGDLIAYLESSTLPGDTITLNILRDGQPVDVAVHLSERPGSTF